MNQAARYGFLDVVKQLVEAGADIENVGGASLTPLMNASLAKQQTEGHLAIVQLLLGRGAVVSQDLLSSVQTRINILEENAEAGMVNPAAVERWTWFIKFLQLAQIKQVRPKTERNTEADARLLKAADAGDLDELAAAIGAGANANASDGQDISALRWAAGARSVGAVRALLDAGAEVDRQSGTGWTALMQAVIVGSVEVVKLLLERGAVVEADGAALFFARDVVQYSEDKAAAGEIIGLLEARSAEK